MAKSNCQFSGTGGQYFPTVLIHLLILGSITFGIYSPWAWVMIFRLRASHSLINGKSVKFTGTGGQLLGLALVQGLLTLITLGLYGPWAICRFFAWKARHTVVGGKPSQFTGTGGSLFILYLIHLMILPMLTLGIYFFLGLYKLYAWEEENLRYGGEKTTFGGGFGGFLKATLGGWILTCITFYLFMPWALCMLYKWQTTGLAVGGGEDVEHFPPVKINPLIVIILLAMGLVPLFFLGKSIMEEYDKGAEMMRSQSQPVFQTPTGKPAHKGRPMLSLPGVLKKTPLAEKMASEKETKKEEPPALDQAIKKLDDLIQKYGDHADIFYNRGVLYDLKGDPEQAIIDYSKAIEIDKKHVDARHNRGLVYVEKERYEEAIRDFSAALRVSPDSVDALCNRGNVYYVLGNYDAAIADYTSALKQVPEDADIYTNRSLAYGAKGDSKNGFKDAEKARQLRDEGAEKGGDSGKEQTGQTGDAIWIESLDGVQIPEQTASGMIHGDRFTVESAILENGILTIRDGKDFFPDHALTIFLFLDKGDTGEGKSFDIKKTGGFSSPHIHMKYILEGRDLPETEMFMDNYVMRLDFGNMENNRLPGKIYICLPDEMKSFVGGTFMADMK